MQTISTMNNKTILTIITALPIAAGTIIIIMLVVGAVFNIGDDE